MFYFKRFYEGQIMKNRIFNRYERKYLIKKTTMNSLLLFLQPYLSYDPYSHDGNHYTIYNIYFDNDQHHVIRNSIERLKYKDKLRIRTYEFPVTDESLVFLEIKKKFQGRVNKRRVTLTYKDAKHYIENQVIPTFDDYMKNQMMMEIDYFKTLHHAKPGAFIAYDRIAMLSEHDDLRITFDFNMKFRTHDVNFDSSDGKYILPHRDDVLMEIKSDQNFPLWLVNKLSELKLFSQSFSKYGKAYEHYIGGLTDDDSISSD